MQIPMQAPSNSTRKEAVRAVTTVLRKGLTNGMPITIGSGYVENTSCRNVVDMRQAINGDDVLYLQDDIRLDPVIVVTLQNIIINELIR